MNLVSCEITVVQEDRVILSSSKLPAREGAILGHYTTGACLNNQDFIYKSIYENSIIKKEISEWFYFLKTL